MLDDVGAHLDAVNAVREHQIEFTLRAAQTSAAQSVQDDGAEHVVDTVLPDHQIAAPP
jgi:hypothetical protein